MVSRPHWRKTTLRVRGYPSAGRQTMSSQGALTLLSRRVVDDKGQLSAGGLVNFPIMSCGVVKNGDERVSAARRAVSRYVSKLTRYKSPRCQTG